ncbi:hypothetical protein OG203_25785 [Nocardia sp. NBC_01499]|uniref:hypothetical protein n=1 Tax=Nocardia sp. NBC_01499 TaxID=2903597 RepID=UPI00386FC908
MPAVDSTITIPLKQYAQINARITELTITSLVLVELLCSTLAQDCGGAGEEGRVCDSESSRQSGREPETYTLREAAELLQRNGLDIGQHRLKSRLYQLGWVDERNVPTAAPLGALVLASPVRDNRDAVVRVTPEGLNRLRDALMR